ncbi:hypothetical protein M433DRAFT_3269 [Acidomyces richmondensis BFW]|nr:MAG: hypothetical protein FE78DRAFT_28584 [Acidomyces sp. 'richmondensis']KYG46974.1 hypothetical protein M433DRAFT_3269 [Acidomyces richmondensis BFW]
MRYSIVAASLLGAAIAAPAADNGWAPPAYSQAPGTETVWQTETDTITSCAATVTNCPARSHSTEVAATTTGGWGSWSSSVETSPSATSPVAATTPVTSGVWTSPSTESETSGVWTSPASESATGVWTSPATESATGVWSSPATESATATLVSGSWPASGSPTGVWSSPATESASTPVSATGTWPAWSSAPYPTGSSVVGATGTGVWPSGTGVWTASSSIALPVYTGAATQLKAGALVGAGAIAAFLL